MKLIRTLAVALTLLLCLAPAMAESGNSRIDELAHTIRGEISFGKYPHDLMIIWMDDYTVAEFEAAAVKAVESCVANPPAFFTMEPMWESYLDGSFFESAEYLSILAEYGLTRTGEATHGALIRDLGDESVPLYALCAAAAVVLGGAIFANRKRAHA